ncbi:oligosaccharide flippase family protein [Rhodococcus sp. 14-1411-2a]|uniref:oligosaccharide flippase family protein n=1 Tax=Rhodococcus sp. 14-1411-2a TaxID=2023151 RepID=UPI000B9AAF4D|nr:oligosaccharide flippase family protein [Rhodococcus sp. 14-1411-2a]OZF51287.1 hypothetical protein CH291_06900 [Rhodococcus sp. 14-1411-2a]
MSAAGVLRGAAWTYGAQIATIMLQLAYAATTSRLVGAGGFGTYAVSLIVAGMVTLLASSGLGQSVGRLMELQAGQLSKLNLFSWLVGSIASAFVYLSADTWATIWGDSEAASPIRMTAALALVSPPLGVATGLMRRTGEFRSLAVLTLFCNAVGMLAGGFAAYQWRSASSLVASAIIAQCLLVVCATYQSRKYLLRSPCGSKIRSLVIFSWKITIANMLSYFTGNITRWGVSRMMGPAALGSWNRAEVVTTIPFQQLQSAMVQAVYPEFRHDIDSPKRARQVWPEMLTLAAWVAFPTASVLAVLGPEVIPVLLGPGWTETSQLVPYLAVAAGLQLISTLLASAVEALGRFGWIWSTQGILITVQLISLFVLWIYRDLIVAVSALIVTGLVRHAYHVFLCVRANYIGFPRLARGYAEAVTASLLLSGPLLLLLNGLSKTGSPLPYFVLALVPLLSFGCLFVLIRRSLLIEILAKYGWIPSKVLSLLQIRRK